MAKLYAYWITINYREAYGMFACNGILFNHESPVRGETFVTRKITRALARIKLGLQDALYLGNLDSLRDWGHARDYVEMQWLMLQQPSPDDFVIATGVQYSVRDFINAAASELDMKIRWEGTGLNEVGYLVSPSPGVESAHPLSPSPGAQSAHPLSPSSGVRAAHPLSPSGGGAGGGVEKPIVRVDPRYFRPTEVETLLGDPTKAREKLGWVPKVSFQELVGEMTREDLKTAERDELIKKHGYTVFDHNE